MQAKQPRRRCTACSMQMAVDEICRDPSHVVHTCHSLAHPGSRSCSSVYLPVFPLARTLVRFVVGIDPLVEPHCLCTLIHNSRGNISHGSQHRAFEPSTDFDNDHRTCFGLCRGILHQALQGPVEDDRAAEAGPSSLTREILQMSMLIENRLCHHTVSYSATYSWSKPPCRAFHQTHMVIIFHGMLEPRCLILAQSSISISGPLDHRYWWYLLQMDCIR